MSSSAGRKPFCTQSEAERAGQVEHVPIPGRGNIGVTLTVGGTTIERQAA